MTVIRPGSPWRGHAVARALLLPVAVSLMLAGCNTNTNRAVTGNVGVGTGVSLTTPGSITQLQVATSMVVSASVSADVNNAGVTWALAGSAIAMGATLSNITPTSVTFNAPTASFDGAVDATITATSVVNPAVAASVTLLVLGRPVMNPPQLFPGNVNVPYGASITVAGGLAPFTWTMAANSGPLPPGIILNGSIDCHILFQRYADDAGQL